MSSADASTGTSQGPSDITTQAYGQWVCFKIISSFRAPDSPSIGVRNARLEWGKFYDDGDKNAELSSTTINKIVIARGESAKIYSCGRENASSGTEGSFELWVDGGNAKICKVSWDCPWGVTPNSFGVSNTNEDYPVTTSSDFGDGGPLGDITIKVHRSG